MKKTTKLFLRTPKLLLTVATLAALCVSCEDSSSTESSVVITPGYAELREGQSVTLTASGWDSYTWSLAEASWGFLSDTTGDTVVYTASRSAGADGASVNQTVFVRAASTGLSQTNTTGNLTGRATIRHVY